MKIRIDWETDGENVDLPKELVISDMPEGEIADYLSDHFGWLINSIEIVKETK